VATSSRVRPYDEQGKPVVVDLGCLTTEQRRLWERTFPHRRPAPFIRWSEATCGELLDFDFICILEDEPPRWPPAVRATLKEYGRMVRDYVGNVRAARERGEP
jgi:hypothetical protein